MTVEIPNMLVSMVGIVVALAAGARAGYSYHAPSTLLDAPRVNHNHLVNSYNHPKRYPAVVDQPSHQYLGNTVTYSVAPNDLNYLRQYQGGNYLQQSGFTPITTHRDNKYQINSGNNGYYNQASQSNVGSGNLISSQQVAQQPSIGSGSLNHGGYNIISPQEVPQQPSISSGTVNHGGYNIISPQEVPQQPSIGSGSLNHGGYNTFSSQEVPQQPSSLHHGDYSPGYASQPALAPAPAVVTKHIYFHVPPQEMEERPVQILPPTPPKKVYNIVFIKVPSQQSRNRINIQGLVASQQALVEDKTLIYVLVKRPEPQPLPQLQPPVNSEHEVFYVKYKGNANEAASQINDNLSQQDSLQSTGSVIQSDVQSVIEPILQSQSVIEPDLQSVDAGLHQTLQPGLINGRL